MRALAILLLVFTGCKNLPIDSSAFAAVAGQSTLVLGSCHGEWGMGWEQCLAEKGGEMPTLRFLMMNPGEWAVSDCELGLYKTGAVSKKEVVEVDLAGLSEQAQKNGFCVLKIEAIERYKDNRANLEHEIPIRGGFFLEMVEPGYFPTPSRKQVAFCVKAYRTTSGRTAVVSCNQ